MYKTIETQADIEHFLDAVNGLHDGYLIAAEYLHSGHSTGNPHWIDPEKTELRLRYQVTSIWDRIVELRFTGLHSFQLRDDGGDIVDCRLRFDQNAVVWADDEDENGSIVRAARMQWCFVS